MACGESKKMCRVYWDTHTRSSFTGVLGVSVFMGDGESKKMCRMYWYTHARSSFTWVDNVPCVLVDTNVAASLG